MCSTVFRLGLQDFFWKAAAFNRIFYHQNIQNVSLLKINLWPSIASTRRRVGAAIEDWPVQGEIMEWATPVALTTEHSEFCSSACVRYQQCFAREETTFESLQYLEISPWNINKELLIQYLWCWWETESLSLGRWNHKLLWRAELLNTTGNKPAARGELQLPPAFL